jgi:hypothetical protein
MTELPAQVVEETAACAAGAGKRAIAPLVIAVAISTLARNGREPMASMECPFQVTVAI